MTDTVLKLISVLAAAVFLPFLCAACRPETPVIHSINPQIGNLGEPVTITGEHFGEERGESYITIAGARPTSMSYLAWTDNEITVLTPEFGEAGLLYVHVRGGKSNGALFANQASLPKQPSGAETGLGPKIASVTPQAGAIGTPLTITGTGFGGTRGEGGVFFTWNAQMPAAAAADARIPEFTAVSEAEFGYELWTDREIRVRVPDGAASGNMEIRTARGTSPPLFFDISGRPGTKTFRDKRSYTISYSVNIKTTATEQPNTLYLWVPRPVSSTAQRNIELLSCNPEPFIEDYRGACLFKLDNLAADSEFHIGLSWKIEVYGAETSVRTQSIRQDTRSAIYETHTQNTPQLPSSDPAIRTLAADITGRERNPYLKARKIYDWILKSIEWESQNEGTVLSAAETKKADPYLVTMLYCTLLRSAGIPALPLAGVIVNRNQETVNHYWTEFWLDDFGWIPADPALGAGAIPLSFITRQAFVPDNESGGGQERDAAADFYFGNIDSQRIVFSRGFVNFTPMDPRGRTLVHNRSYSLQNLWEEAVGGIEAYSSLWGDIIITGMYAQ